MYKHSIPKCAVDRLSIVLSSVISESSSVTQTILRSGL